MRRTLSLLLLLCFAWAQAAAATCPMGASGEEAPASHHDGNHSAHAAHMAHGAAQGGAASVQAAEDSRPDAPALLDCAMATSCGVIALPTSDGDGDRLTLLVLRSPARELDRYASPSLTADPPPPRAAVPS
jgi:hypothetical protein